MKKKQKFSLTLENFCPKVTKAILLLSVSRTLIGKITPVNWKHQAHVNWLLFESKLLTLGKHFSLNEQNKCQQI